MAARRDRSTYRVVRLASIAFMCKSSDTSQSDTSKNQLDGGVGDESGAVMARGGSGLGFEWAFGRGGLPHKGPLQAAGWCSASQI